MGLGGHISLLHCNPTVTLRKTLIGDQIDHIIIVLSPCLWSGRFKDGDQVYRQSQSVDIFKTTLAHQDCNKICHQFAMTSVCHCSIVLLLHKQSFTLTLESNQNLTDSKQKFLCKCDLSVKCQAVSNLAFIIRMQPVKCKNTWVVLIGAHLLWLLHAYKLGLGAVICKFSSVCLRGVAVRLPALSLGDQLVECWFYLHRLRDISRIVAFIPGYWL